MTAESNSGNSFAVHRLQTRAQFQAVLGGATVSKTAHFALHCCAVGLSADNEAAPLFTPAGIWLGAMVPKRWAKRAVTRNTIKRQIYQLGGQFAPALKEKAHLVRLRRDFDRKHFVSATSDALKAAVREELLELFGRIVGDLPLLPPKPHPLSSRPQRAACASARADRTMMRALLIGLVRAYRFCLSPWLGSACRFNPTCSLYALEALGRHGATIGSYLTVARLVRCHPWCAGGHDPVPENAPRLFGRLIQSPSEKKPS